MGFKSYIKEARAGIIATNYSGDLSGFDSLSLFTYSSSTGVDVNERSALEVTAVWAAIRVIAESIASLPFNLYEKSKDGKKSIAERHPVHKVLQNPNPYMTAFTFWETLVSHVLLWGNAYAEIEWDNAGQVKALWLLRPDMTRPIVDTNGSLYYQTNVIDKTVNLPYYKVLHIYGLGFDGLMGYSPIRLYRETIGLAKATERYGATYFGNGAKPGGVLESPNTLSDPAVNRLRESWNQMHSGLENSHRVAILEEGLSYKQIGLPPEDSQFLETRKFQIAEISRIYRVPLHMLSELERSTNNNIEHQGIEFLTYTLIPWLTKISQAVDLKCLLDVERKKLKTGHVPDALLRGDAKTRYEGYQVLRQNGVMSANDILEAEGKNPIPDEEGGNAYLVNAAMVSVKSVMNPPEPQPQQQPPVDPQPPEPKGGGNNGQTE